MRTLKYLSLIALSLTVLWSCSDDDNGTPPPVNEEELITTVIAILTDGNQTITLSWRDVDGDGGNDPVIEVDGNFTVGTTYTGAVTVLNETETPPEDITEEVEEEAEEHQFLFLPGNGLDMTVNYLDEDADGNPIGILFNATGNTAGSGNFRIVLKHEPTKPNDGSFAGAGGETDIDVTFPVTIE